MNPTDILVESIYNLMNAEIPEDVILEAKKCILDFLGTAFAGAEMLKPKNLAYLEHFPNGHGTSTVIGLQKKASMHNAAFINGMNSHITELDDGQRYCYVHLGSTILPALLAVAEHENLGAGGLLRGIIMGYESAIRLGRAIQPSHKNRGYHVSGTCGTIGAATAVAAALNFSKEQMKDAISAAAASAAGMLEVLEDQSELKPFNIGRASLDGLTAAYVARAGFHGPDDILGGKRGFFALMSDQYDISGLSDEAGCEYNIKFIYRKPYAACRHCHPPIEAAINIRNRQGIRGKDVKSINVYTYKQAVFGHDHTTIQGMPSLLYFS
jgi:2-methylcitrate dehydratase PrpD